MPPGSRPNYDFLNAKPPSKSRFSLPTNIEHFSGISLISILVIVVIILMVVLFGSSGSAYKDEIDIIARGQEILRTTALASQAAQDQDLKDLAATVSNNISSQQQQLLAYLAAHGQKVNPANELTYKNTSTDAQFNSAAQNDSLDQTYKTYLKINLNAYQNALQQAYKTAKTNEKNLLASDFNANATLLNTL